MSKASTLFEISSERLKDQADTQRLITTKASIMLGVAVLIARADIPGETVGVVLISLAYTCLSICVVCGLLAIYPHHQGDGPNLERAAEVLNDYDLEVAKEWIAEVNMIACRKNVQQLNSIERWLRWGLWSLAASMLFFVLSRADYAILSRFCVEGCFGVQSP